MLMDEPFGAIDPITRTRLQDEFLRILHDLRKTIVFVTHDIDEAIRMGDRIAIMKDGALVQYDTPEAILAAPADAFVEAFVGADRALKRLALIPASAAIDAAGCAARDGAGDRRATRACATRWRGCSRWASTRWRSTGRAATRRARSRSPAFAHARARAAAASIDSARSAPTLIGRSITGETFHAQAHRRRGRARRRSAFTPSPPPRRTRRSRSACPAGPASRR